MRDRIWLLQCLFVLGSTLASVGSLAQEQEKFSRTRDVVYGRKPGMALTFDVFTPRENPSGAAVIWVVSGGWA